MVPLHPMTKEPIFTQDDIAAIDAAEAHLLATIPVIDAAESAGIDVAEYRQINASLRDQLVALKTAFATIPKIRA